MSLWRYVPGEFVAVVSEQTAVMVQVDPADPLAGDLFEVLSERHTMEDVVETLLGRGLKQLGGFAAAHQSDGGIRVVVRGDFSAVVADQPPVAGTGLWADQFVPAAESVRLGGLGGARPSFPLRSGVVLAGEVRLGKAPEIEPPLALQRPSVMAAPSAGEVHDQTLRSALESLEDPTPGRGGLSSEPSDDLAPIGELGADSEFPDDASTSLLESAPQSPAPVGAARREPVAFTAVSTSPAMEVGPLSSGLELDWLQTLGGGPPEPDEMEVEPADARGPAGQPIEPDGWEGQLDPVERVAASPFASPEPTPAPDLEAFEMTVDRRRLVEHAVAPSKVMVIAARCPVGHLSPAHAGTCRVCRRPLPPQEPMEVLRPQLGVLRLSNGDPVALDRGAILGRNPRLPSGYSGDQPNLVQLPDPNKDISSQHLEVTLDYWHVVITDLGSTNGTEVELPNQPAVQLRPNDPMTIEPGTRVVLAGVLEFVFEVTG